MSESGDVISNEFNQSNQGLSTNDNSETVSTENYSTQQENPKPELKPTWARGKTQKNFDNFKNWKAKQDQEPKQERLKDKFQRRRRM